MTFWVICTGLIIVPFIPIPGFSIAKSNLFFMGLFFLGTILSSLHRGINLKVNNKWLMFFLIAMFLGIVFQPPYMVRERAFGIYNPWVYKPILNIILAFLTFAIISNYKFEEGNIKLILSIMSWVGFLMAIYVFLQFLGMEQFFMAKKGPLDKIATTTSFDLAGSLGQPTIVASFIAMIIPIMMYKKYWVKAIFSGLVVGLIFSEVALIGLSAGLFTYWCIKQKWVFFGGVCIVAILAITIFILHVKEIDMPFVVHDGGRFKEWIKIMKQVRDPLLSFKGLQFSILGFGMGSFPYFYTIMNDSLFYRAHSAPVELFFNTGIAGLILITASLHSFIKKMLEWINYGDLTKALFSSFVVILICSFGNFVLQTGAIVFYSIIILGLIGNIVNSYDR